MCKKEQYRENGGRISIYFYFENVYNFPFSLYSYFRLSTRPSSDTSATYDVMPCLYQHLPRVQSSSLMPFWIQFHFLIGVQRMMAPNKSYFLLACAVGTRGCCISRGCGTHKEKDIRYISGDCTTQWSHLRNLIFSEMINQPEHQNTHEFKYKQNKSFIYLNFKSAINYSHSQSSPPPRDERGS